MKMSAKHMMVYKATSELRTEFFKTKKVGPYFSAFAAIIADNPDFLSLADQYNADAAMVARKAGAEAFAACAAKYGFPVKF